MRTACEASAWGDLPIEKTMSGIVAAGYEGIETSVEEYLRRPGRLKALLRAHALALASTAAQVAFDDAAAVDGEIEAVVQRARFLKAFGAAHIVVQGAHVERGDTLPIERHRLFADSANRLGEALAGAGVRPAFHQRVGTVVESPREIDLLCANTDGDLVDMCFDTGDLHKAGADAVEYFQKYARRVRYVHLKDYREGHFCALGNGEVDLKGVVSVLRRNAYDGWLVCELGPAEAPLECARSSRDWLARNCGI